MDRGVRVKDRIQFAVTGNHDIHTNGGEPLQSTWAARQFGTVGRGSRTPSGRGMSWSSTATAGSLRDRCTSQSEQLTLAPRGPGIELRACTLALIHQPRFSSGDHGNDPVIAPFWDELYAANAELVLAGHDHDYERFAAQTPDATPDDARGLVQFVAGTGGAALEAFKDPRPNSIARINDTHGVLELTLLADSWSSRFVDTTGEARDAASGTCH